MGREEEELSGGQGSSARGRERGFQRGGELNAARRFGIMEMMVMPPNAGPGAPGGLRTRPHCSDPGRKEEARIMRERVSWHQVWRETCHLQVTPSPGEKQLPSLSSPISPKEPLRQAEAPAAPPRWLFFLLMSRGQDPGLEAPKGHS